MTNASSHRRRDAFPPDWPMRLGLLALAAYVIYAATIIDLGWSRFVIGIDQGARFIARMLPPNMAPDKLSLLYNPRIGVSTRGASCRWEESSWGQDCGGSS